MGWGPAQKQVYDSDATYDLLRGPKGAGKTQVAVYRLLQWAAQNHKGRELLVCTPSVRQYKNAVMPLVRRWHEVCNLPLKTTADGFRSGANQFIRAIGKDSGSISSILSLNLVGAYLLEFNEQPQDFVDEVAFSRVRVTDNRKVILDYNPAGTKHWAETQYWDRSEELGIARHQFTLDDNPGLEPEWVELQHRKYPPGTHQHTRYVLGLPCDQSGRVWKNVTFGTPPRSDPLRLVVSMDAGNSLDHPAHALLIGIWPSAEWVLDEWRHPLDADGAPLSPDEQAERVMSAMGRWGKVGAVVVDDAALYQINAFRRMGVNAAGWGKRTVKFGIEVADSYLTRGILRIAKDRTPHLEREVLNYVWAKDSDDREKERMPVKRDDHGPDALRGYCEWRNRMRSRQGAKPRRTA